MWKDYIAVEKSDSKTDEARFIEDYWSKVYKEKGLADPSLESGDIAHNMAAYLNDWVEKREEYVFLRKFMSRFPEDGGILDGGCGLGKWTLYWEHLGFKATGLDISTSTVERLNKLFPGRTFVQGDIRKTDFDEASFDVYTSWGTFEHFEDGLGLCFREAYRILKPGGLLFISVPFQNGRFVRKIKQPLSVWEKDFDPANGYQVGRRFYQWRLTKSELHREFEIGGFQLLDMAEIHSKFGLHRLISEDFGFPNKRVVHKLLYGLARPIVPSSYYSHMIIAAGQKR